MKGHLFSGIISLFCWLSLLQKQLISAYNIDVMDYQMDYTNINDVTEFKFVFQLQSGLASYNFLRLSFPFALYTTSISKVQVKYSFQGNNSCSQRQKFSAIIALDGASTTDYFISFLDDISTPTSLKGSPYWYALFINPEPGMTFSVGQQKPITARTQSIDSVAAIYGTPIIYDNTNMFGVLEFTADPATSLTVATAIASTYSAYQYIVGQNYEISFVITPTIAIPNAARFMILVYLDQRFTFIGNCLSEEHTDGSTTIPPLDSTDYTCSVDSEYNRIVVELNISLVAGQIYRFRTTMLNPVHVTTVAAGIDVRTMLSSSNQIIEKLVVPSILKTNPLTATKTVIMGNGIDLNSVTYYQYASIISGNNFFNPFKLIFTPSITTPDDALIKVCFKLPIDMTNDIVLPGSIQHSFPRYNFKTPVSCQLVTYATYYNIECVNIGPMNYQKLYFVTVRIFFLNPGTLSNTFGSVTVYTIDSSGSLITLIAETVQTFGTSTITANAYRVDTSTTAYGYQMMHSQISYDSSGTQLSLSAITSTSSGIKVCTSPDIKQKIVVTFAAANTVASFGAGPGYAMSLLTTPLIQAAPGTTGNQFYVESLTSSCSVSTEFPNDVNKIISTTTDQTQIILFSAASTADCIQQNSGPTTTFSIGDVNILSGAAGYAGRDSFDFYGALFSNYASGVTPTSYFAVNSFTISMGGNECTSTRLSYINVALSNYQTSSGAQTQLADGTKYPAFIRITGYLSDEENSDVQRIAVFFNNVDFYSLSADSYGQMKVSCSSSMNINQQCWGFPGLSGQSTSIYTMKRVEFDVSAFISQTGSSSPFQLLIPIKAIGSLNTQRIFVSTLARNPLYGQLTQAFVSQYTQSAWKIIVGSTAASYSPLTDLSYNLVVTSKIEGQQSSADLEIGHTASVPSCLQNNPAADTTNIGAAFVIVGKWKMYSNTLSVISTGIVNTNIKSEGCLPFSYLLSGSYQYGIYCPFTLISSTQNIVSSTTVTFGNFVFPALGIYKLSGTYITWSQNTGALISVLADPTPATATLTPNAITDVANIVLRRYVKDNRVSWLFTTSNPFPKDGVITIKLDDSSGTWGPFTIMTGNLARCILYKQTGTFAETACVVSTDPTNLKIIFTFSATTDFDAGAYKLVQYGFSSPTTSLSSQYAITIKTQTSAGLVIDTSTNSKKLTFDNSATYNTNVLINYSFNTHYLIEGAYGNYEIDFTIDTRPILALSTPTPGAGLVSGQYIELQVQELAGQESWIQCYILQADGSMYFGFKSMDISASSSIKLFPRSDILVESMEFIFHCLNVKNVYLASKTIKISLLYNGGTQTSITKTSSPTAIAYTTPIAFNSMTVKKYHGLAGGMHQFNLAIVLASNSLTPQSSIFMTFPQKYNQQIGTATLYCKINSKPTYCVNYAEYKLQISGFPVTIAAGTLFSIDVFGVYGPLSVSGSDSIQISFASSRDPSTVKEQTSVTDGATLADFVTTLQLSYATQTNYISRVMSVYQFNFVSPAAISAGQYLLLEFPREFGTSITVMPPTTCVITNVAGSTTYGSTFENFGTNIMITVSAAIPASTTFMVVITSLRTPEDSGCTITKIVGSILSSDRLTVLAKTSVASSNQPLIRADYNDNLSYINWYKSSTQVKFNENVLTIISGSYSPIISLKDSSAAISKMITFTLATVVDAEFSLISDLNIYPGQITEDMRIGCPTGTVPSLFTLIFTKTEIGTASYGEFSLLNVKVSDSQHIIIPEFLTYYVFSGGYSIPIVFDLSDMIPYDSVSVLFSVVIVGTDPKIELVDDSGLTVTELTLNFSPDSYKGKIMVRSLVQMTATAAHNSKLVMTIFGTDSASYLASTTDVMLQLISASPTPSLSYTQAIDQVSPYSTIQNVTITANLPLTVYYHIRLSTGPSRPLAEVRNLIDQYVVLNPVDYFQEQFGFFNYQGQGTSVIYQIPKLRSKLTYLLTTWVIDTLQRTTAGQNTTFSTKNNDGRVLRIPIEFQTTITNAQKLLITCYMCQKFAVPCLNVISFDNIYCASYSRYSLSITDSVNTNFQRRRRLVSQDQAEYEIDEADLEKEEEEYEREYYLSDYPHRNLASSSVTSTVSFYSLSIDEFTSDLSWSSIITIVKSSTFETEIAALDPTLPSIVSIATPVEIVKKTAVLAFANMATVEAGSTWIFFTGIEANQRSLIWLYLVDYQSGGTPTPQQMKFMLTSRNKTSSNFHIFLYNTSSTISVNFTNLVAETEYALYMLATPENPSLFTTTTNISFVGEMTLADDSSSATFANRIQFGKDLLKFLLFIVLGWIFV